MGDNGITSWSVYRVGASGDVDAMARALTSAMRLHHEAGRGRVLAVRVNRQLATVAADALRTLCNGLPAVPVQTAGAGGVLVGEVWLATGDGPGPRTRSLTSRAADAQRAMTPEDARQLALGLEVR